MYEKYVLELKRNGINNEKIDKLIYKIRKIKSKLTTASKYTLNSKYISNHSDERADMANYSLECDLNAEDAREHY